MTQPVVEVTVSVSLTHPVGGQVGHVGLPVTVMVAVLGQNGSLQGTVAVLVMVVVQSAGATHLIKGQCVAVVC